MQDLNALRVFVRVAEARSFKSAADRLGLTPSAVSKSVTRLENEIGIRLFQRTSRSVRLSNDGETFFATCKRVLDEIGNAEEMLSQAATGLHGRMTVHMSVAFGRRVVMPALVRFIDQNPDLSVQAELSDRKVDLAYEGFDTAIQIGPVTDSRLVARKLCNLRFVACASPDYLARHGEPKVPDELDHHHCIAYAHTRTGRLREWRFMVDGKPLVKNVTGRLKVNNSETVLEAAIAGLGIAMVSNFIAADAIAAGRVKAILAPFAAPGPVVSAVALPGLHRSPKVRAFIEFIRADIQAHQHWVDPVPSSGA